MDVVGTNERMAAYLRDNHDKVVGRWTDLVVAGVRGRTSREEVRRELEDLYDLVVRVLSRHDRLGRRGHDAIAGPASTPGASAGRRDVDPSGRNG